MVHIHTAIFEEGTGSEARLGGEEPRVIRMKPALVPFDAGQLTLYKGTENVYSRPFAWV